MKFGKGGVIMADVPNAGIARRDPNAASGNPQHDVRSGKFGTGGGKKPQQQVPAGSDPLEYARMLDAVRDAAREFDNPMIGDIEEFLKGRAKNPEVVDAQAFLSLVQKQRMDDLVDLLDSSMRRSGILSRGRRKVRVVAPKGYLKKLIHSLQDDQLAQVFHRLEAMGHKPNQIDDYFEPKVGVSKKEAARAKVQPR